MPNQYERETLDECRARMQREIDELRLENSSLRQRVDSADRLAYECARAVEGGRVGSRSGIGDRLLNYLDVGGIDGPSSVPEWMESVRKLTNPAQSSPPKSC